MTRRIAFNFDNNKAIKHLTNQGYPKPIYLDLKTSKTF